MSLIASASNNSGPYWQEGDYNAVCDAIVAVGPVLNTRYNNVSNKVWIHFETDQKTQDGAPKGIWMQQTQSIGSKANLGKLLTQWRGRPFTPEELQKFELTKILGVPAYLTITNNTANNGNTYANIAMIRPARVQMKASAEPWVFDVDDPAKTNWDKVPEFIQKQINESQERLGKATTPITQQQEEKTQVVDNLSDVPF